MTGGSRIIVSSDISVITEIIVETGGDARGGGGAEAGAEGRLRRRPGWRVGRLDAGRTRRGGMVRRARSLSRGAPSVVRVPLARPLPEAPAARSGDFQRR